MNALVELQELGFSLNETKDLMSGGIKTDKLKDALYQKKFEWEQKKPEIERKIEAIEVIEDKIAAKKGKKEISAMTEEERAWFLFNVVCVEELKASKVLSEAIWL